MAIHMRRKWFIVLGVVLLMAVTAGGLFGYQHWQRDNEAWAREREEFDQCSLYAILHHMGNRTFVGEDAYMRPSYEEGPYFNALKKVASDPQLDLDAVRIGTDKWDLTVADPKAGGQRLLAVCQQRVKAGEEGVALHVGRFYLITQKPQAVAWLEAAAEGGMPAAHRLLGVAYRKGMIQGIKDENKALAYFNKAANAGDRQAKLYLAELYGSTDSARAMQYLNAAAEQGSPTAAYRLLRSTTDPRMAYFWGLAFQFILDKERQKEWWHELESNTQYRWEGLPNGVGAMDIQFGVTPKADIITNYDQEAAKHTLDRLERDLPLPSRMVVQELFQLWVKEKLKLPKGS